MNECNWSSIKGYWFMAQVSRLTPHGQRGQARPRGLQERRAQVGARTWGRHVASVIKTWVSSESRKMTTSNIAKQHSGQGERTPETQRVTGNALDLNAAHAKIHPPNFWMRGMGRLWDMIWSCLHVSFSILDQELAIHMQVTPSSNKRQ